MAGRRPAHSSWCLWDFGQPGSLLGASPWAHRLIRKIYKLSSSMDGDGRHPWKISLHQLFGGVGHVPPEGLLPSSYLLVGNIGPANNQRGYWDIPGDTLLSSRERSANLAHPASTSGRDQAHSFREVVGDIRPVDIRRHPWTS
nr:PREDICTED: uncharacterized protein LOC109032935 [Bemisia tabaci]